MQHLQNVRLSKDVLREYWQLLAPEERSKVCVTLKAQTNIKAFNPLQSDTNDKLGEAVNNADYDTAVQKCIDDELVVDEDDMTQIITTGYLSFNGTVQTILQLNLSKQVPPEQVVKLLSLEAKVQKGQPLEKTDMGFIKECLQKIEQPAKQKWQERLGLETVQRRFIVYCPW